MKKFLRVYAKTYQNVTVHWVGGRVPTVVLFNAAEEEVAQKAFRASKGEHQVKKFLLDHYGFKMTLHVKPYDEEPTHWGVLNGHYYESFQTENGREASSWGWV